MNLTLMEFALMKCITLVVISIFSHVVQADYIFDEETIMHVNYSDRKMFSETRNALFSYDVVQEKSSYWSKRIEKVVMGQYTEKFLVLAPFVTGKIEFNADKFRFYIDAREEASGVRYTYRF
jgi:hypothetical protein